MILICDSTSTHMINKPYPTPIRLMKKYVLCIEFAEAPNRLFY